MTNKFGQRLCDTEMKTEQKTWEAMSAEERDALVAEKLMGWTRHPDKMDPTDNRTINGVLYCAPGFEGYNGGSAGQFNVVPSFSASISAAFEVLEKLRADGFILSITNPVMNWRVAFINGNVWVGSESDSLPEAIVLAALRAKGIEV